MKNTKVLLAALLGLSTLIPTQASAVTIDGNLADWGLRQTGSATDFVPNGTLVPGVTYTSADGIAPGRGGQAYDAEGLYTYMDSTYLYVALVTGLSPSETTYPAGDFAIDFGRDGTFEFGIETMGANRGNAYRVSTWNYGLWDSTGAYNPANPDVTHPTNIATGTQVATGNLVYNSTSVTNMGTSTADSHYFMEAAIPLSAFSGFSGNFNIHWTMSCANDIITVGGTLPGGGGGGGVPEPATLALLALGLGLMVRKSRSTSGLTA